MATRDFTEEELKMIASQLRKPQGDMGLTVAEKMNQGNAFINRDTISLLQLQDGDDILEIGMGNGYFVKELLEKCSGLTYTGLDYSRDMVEAAKEFNKRFIGSGEARFLYGSAQETKFEEDRFDLIFTINTIYFWPSIDKTLAELRRILKPGKRLYISIRPKEAMKSYPVVKYGFNIFTGEAVEEALLKNGFTETRIKKICEPEQDIWGQRGLKYSNIISGVKG